MLATGHCNPHVSLKRQFFCPVAVKVVQRLSPSLHYFLSCSSGRWVSRPEVLSPPLPRHCSESSRRRRCPRLRLSRKAERKQCSWKWSRKRRRLRKQSEPTEAWKVCRKPRGSACSRFGSEVLTPWPGGFSKHWFLLNPKQLFLPHSFWNKVTPCRPVKYFQEIMSWRL